MQRLAFSNTWTHSLLRTGEAVRVTVVACRAGKRRGGGVRLGWVVSAKKEALPPPRCRIVRTGVRTWPVSRLGLATLASWCPSGSFRQMLQARGPLRPGGFPYGVFVPAFQASNLSADRSRTDPSPAREPCTSSHRAPVMTRRLPGGSGIKIRVREGAGIWTKLSSPFRGEIRLVVQGFGSLPAFRHPPQIRPGFCSFEAGCGK